MSQIEIYTTPYCPYCIAAKELLTRKGAAFKEIDVSRDSKLRTEMIKRANGGYTVPQIFIGDDARRRLRRPLRARRRRQARSLA